MPNNWKSTDGVLAGAVPFGGEFTAGGIVSGLQFGYNRQIGRLVWGAEADVSFADIDGAARCAQGVYVCDAHVSALGTVTGRLGFAYGQLLLYGKGGGAWAYEKFEMTPSPGLGASNNVFQGKQFRFGWTVGVGAEYAFTPGLSARLEYNWLSFNQGTVDLADSSGNRLNVQLGQDIHLFKLGVNYKLSDLPPFFGSMPTRSAALAAPTSNWNGFYVGVHTGGAFGTTDWKSADGTLAQLSSFGFAGAGSMDGSIFGVQIGANRQFGSWVIGAEADASWTNTDGYAKCGVTDSPDADQTRAFVCHSRINALGTLTGRIGQIYGNLLIYSKAGGAWALTKDESYLGSAAHFTGSSKVQFGYVLGSGLEYAFTPAWSGRIEYSYVDLGTRSTALTDTLGNVSNVRIAQNLHTVKLGLNYALGVDPSAVATKSSTPFAVKAPQRSDWVVEAGTRYWYSNGKSQQDLFDSNGMTVVNSRLIYGDMNGHSVEAFFRFDHISRLFVKGNFGMGTLVNGKLNDEDQPPNHSPYSNTVHEMRDGGLRYGSVDVGYNLIEGPAGKLGAFVGYRYFYQRGRGFGCSQIGFDTSMCTPADPATAVGLTETEQWRGGAIGLNAQLALSRRWKVELDAAYLPYVDRSGVDNHWNRANINPGPETGRGWGTQVEAIVTYAVTQRFSVGLGGRYWFFYTNKGESQFPGAANATPLNFSSDRYGGFLQASYKFGPGADAVQPDVSEEPTINWTGVYAGGHLGAGYGRSYWADPYPAPPSGDRTKLGGALGGTQVGVNYQIGNVVLGAEAAGSFSRLEGSDTCFGGFVPSTQAALQCENRTEGLATLTGRIGYAHARTLVYIKGGGAMARERYVLNSRAAGTDLISTQHATNFGWTLGAGLEHALTANWSVNVEYKYLDFGTRTIGFEVPAAYSAVANEPIKSERQMVTMGVNYRFGAPPVAKR